MGAAMRTSYDLKGHNTYWIREIQRRIRLILVSDLPRDAVERMGFLCARNPAEALERAAGLTSPRSPVHVIAHGNVTVLSRRVESGRAPVRPVELA
jgi:nickel-dependent lactate racemase